MLSVAEALERVLTGVSVLDRESVPLAMALGRVLVEPVVAGREIPPWDNSSMDGYAVRGVDTRSASAGRPVTLTVVGEVTAGTVAKREVGPGQAYRILTGAPLPPGSDAVVPQEEVRRDGEEVILERPVQPGAYVRPRGEDIRPGDRMLEPGTVLRPAALGVLAALGHARVDVYRRPIVAVLSTGDELVEPDAPLGPGQIPDSNTYTLGGLVTEAGGCSAEARDRARPPRGAGGAVPERAGGGRAGVLGGRVRRGQGLRPRRRGGPGCSPGFLEGEHATGQAAHLWPGRQAALLRASGEPVSRAW